MKLNNWSVVYHAKSAYQAPELWSICLHGIVDNHPKLGENVEVTTSRIVKIAGRIITTKSGSIYELGYIDPNYLTWMTEQGFKYNEENPIKIKEYQ